MTTTKFTPVSWIASKKTREQMNSGSRQGNIPMCMLLYMSLSLFGTESCDSEHLVLLFDATL